MDTKDKSVFKDNKSIIICFIAIAFGIALWVVPAHSLLGFNIGLSNNWWLDLVKSKDGSVDGSHYSAIINTFLMIPIQILISFLVFLYAYKSFVQLRIQTKIIADSKDEAKFSQNFEILCRRIESDISSIESSLKDKYFNFASEEAMAFYESFLKDREKNFGTGAYNELINFYNLQERHNKFPTKIELAKILVDNWFLLMNKIDIDFLKGSSKAAGICASFISLVENKPEPEKEKIFELVFNFLIGHASHIEYDIRFTTFYIFYSYKAVIGNTSLDFFNFLVFLQKRIGSSFLNTNYGDDAIIIANAMINSERFKISLTYEEALDITTKNDTANIKTKDGVNLDLIIVQSKTNPCTAHKSDIAKAIRAGHCIGSKIYL